jgi:5S rRNA maturation endonuclease (ribonuclease M5)
MRTSTSVRRDQRFTKAHPCPVCGGYDAEARGQGKRCYGFLSSDATYAHCTREEYARDLERYPNSDTFAHRLVGDCRCGERHDPLPDTTLTTSQRAKKKKRIKVAYDYLDANGELLYQVVRFDPKDFRQRRPDGNGGWTWSLNGVQRVPYRLPELLTADKQATTYVAEGEKDVDRLRALGLVATTNPQGAGKWRDEFSEHLRSRHIVVVADNDEDGRQHADQVAQSLHGKAASVKVLELPHLPDKGDVADWLDAGGSAEELVRLAQEAPEWEPEDGSFYSSAPRDGVADERIFKWKTAKQVAEETPKKVKWVAKPWVAKGAITEVDGRIKAAGKTTWVAHMVRKVLDGELFMGEPTTKTKVVFLTEQPPTSLRRVLERADLVDREDLLILSWADTRGVDWLDVARAAVDRAIEFGAELLVVDTLAQFAGIRGDAENSAGAAQEAMKPLQEAAANDLAVVITRHERKGGGEVGESGRGSSAFGGAVDIILALRRAEGNVRPTVRVIESLSRFDETPDKLVIELTEQGYRSLGNATAFAEQEAMKTIVNLLPSKEENAMPSADVLDKLKEQDIKRTVATEALAKLSDAGTVRRVGEGKKGSPYRYYKPAPDEQKDSSETPAGSGQMNQPDTQIHSSATQSLYADERKDEPPDEWLTHSLDCECEDCLYGPEHGGAV